MMDRIRAALMPQGNRPNMIVQQNTSPLLQQALMQGAYANDPIETPIEGVGRLAQLSAAKNIERSRKEQEKARYGKLAEALGGDNPIAALLQSGDPDLMKIGVQQKFATPKDTRTSAQKDYDAAQKDPAYGEWLLNKAKAGAQTVNNNFPSENKFNDKAMTLQAETFNSMLEDGVNAGRDLAKIDRLEGLFRQFESGAGAGIKAAAGDFGLKIGEGTSEIQAAEAIINSMVPEQRQPGSGPMSDADLALFKKSLPRLLNTPGGNALIIDTMRGMSEYRRMQGEIAERVIYDPEFTPRMGAKALRELKNPLSEVNAMLNETGSDQAADIKSKYGLE